MKTLQVRLENAEFQEARDVLKDLGLTLPGAVRLFLRKVVLERRIPFSIEIPASRPEGAPPREQPPKDADAVRPSPAKPRQPTPAPVPIVPIFEAPNPRADDPDFERPEAPLPATPAATVDVAIPELEIGFGFGKPRGVRTRVPWSKPASAPAHSPESAKSFTSPMTAEPAPPPPAIGSTMPETPIPSDQTERDAALQKKGETDGATLGRLKNTRNPNR